MKDYTSDFQANQPYDDNTNFIEEGYDPKFFEKKIDDIKARKHQQYFQDQQAQKIYDQFRIVSNRFYFKDQDNSNRIAFSDYGKKIISNSNDERVARAMVTMAQSKGWKSIKVSGHPDFQRKIWLEADRRGINVEGYIPRLKDYDDSDEIIENNYQQKKVDGSLKDASQNQDNRYELDSLDQNVTMQSSKITAQDSLKTSNQNEQLTDHSAPDHKTVQTEERVYVGRLLSHGDAKYNFDEGNKSSYYVSVETSQKKETLWGTDLKRAMSESQTNIGDYVTLKVTGSQNVILDIPDKDKEGESTQKAVKRYNWVVEKFDAAKIAEVVGNKFIDSRVENPEHQKLLQAGLKAGLQEREQAGTVPTVSVYDKHAPSQHPHQEQKIPEKKNDLERTR